MNVCPDLQENIDKAYRKLLVGKGAIISQLRVWLFTFTIIVTCGERNTNPGHRFTGVFSFLRKEGKKGHLNIVTLRMHKTHLYENP